MSNPLSAGDFIEARCSKCKEITNHTVVAMVEDLPAKVKCNTCDGEHKYRKPAAKKAPSTRKPATRRPKVDPLAVERQQWQELQPSFNVNSAVAYSMESIYKLRGLINHPTFGIGQVQEFAGTRKVRVLFEDGAKVLRCG